MDEIDDRLPSRKLAEIMMTQLEQNGYGIQSARDETGVEARLVVRDKTTNAYLRITIVHDTDSY